MMTIEIKAPWHSMDEVPETMQMILIMCYTIEGNILNCCRTKIWYREDWEEDKNIICNIVENTAGDLDCKGFAWCYLSDLAAMEFQRMVKS